MPYIKNKSLTSSAKKRLEELQRLENRKLNAKYLDKKDLIAQVMIDWKHSKQRAEEEIDQIFASMLKLILSGREFRTPFGFLKLRKFSGFGKKVETIILQVSRFTSCLEESGLIEKMLP